MNEKYLEGWEDFISGKYDGVPIDVEGLTDCCLDVSDNPDFDFSKKL